MISLYISSFPNDQIALQVKEELLERGVSLYSSDDAYHLSRDSEALYSKIAACNGFVSINPKDSARLSFESGVAVGLRKPILIVSESLQVPAQLSMYPMVSAFQLDEITYSIIKWAKDLSKPDSSINQPEREDLLESAILASTYTSFSPRTFEVMVLQALLKSGLKASIINGMPDKGYDIDAKSQDGASYAIEVKLLRSGASASLNHVEKLASVKRASPELTCILTCPSGFTPAAEVYARHAGIRLAGEPELLELGRGNVMRFLGGTAVQTDEGVAEGEQPNLH